jgi:hypothetical protein
MENILMRFNMYIVELVNISLAFHCNLSLSLCPNSKEENDYLYHVPYVNIVGRLMFSMKCSRLDIPQAVGVVTGHMENPQPWKWVFLYLRGTSIIYNGYGDLVCGYDSTSGALP